MADLTVDVNWEIMPARQTMEVGANASDQATASDQPFGPEPESPSTPPEPCFTDGK